jgi:hypothetical protein
MRTAVRLGLAAASLAATAGLAGPASANHHCQFWTGTDESLPLRSVVVCVNDDTPLVRVGPHPAGQGVAVCTTGAEPLELWINGQRWLGVVDVPVKCTGLGIGG